MKTPNDEGIIILQLIQQSQLWHFYVNLGLKNYAFEMLLFKPK